MQVIFFHDFSKLLKNVCFYFRQAQRLAEVETRIKQLKTVMAHPDYLAAMERKFVTAQSYSDVNAKVFC